MIRVAVRNLVRNKWRTVLTAGGIAIAVGAVIWTNHLMVSMVDEMIRSATSAQLGDMQIHSEAYLDERNLFNTFEVDRARLDAIRSVDGVDGASGRVLAYGLIGHESQSQVAQLIGVDAVAEAQVTRTPGRVGDGRWLSDKPAPDGAAREVVLGRVLAQQLGIGVGDELVVILQAADGGLGNDRLTVVGTVATGNSNLDRMGAFMHLGDVQWLTALEGRIHEVAIRVADTGRVDELAADVRSVLGKQPAASETSPLVVRAWTEIVPELHQMTQLSANSTWVIFLIVYLIAGLGIFNTQRMTALERRREFGVLLAIGTSPGRLARTIVAESTILTLIGAAFGTVFGILLVLYHHAYGFPLAKEGQSLDYMGVSFSDRLYLDLSAELLVSPLVIVTIVGMLCGLWPAIKSALLDIPRAISGRQ